MPPPAQQPVSGPHSVSLKVLRLSRPSLTTSNILPPVAGHENLQAASLTYPSQSPDAFSLTPLLTLPASFGAAYVGEQFACTLCANRERTPSTETDELRIEDVSILAELQTPSTVPNGIALSLERARDDAHTTTLDTIGQSIQGVVKHDLGEQGNHVLAVTVSYVESSRGGERRARSFRKLYQFVAQQAVGVRSKVGEMRRTGTGKDGRVFALEAQVENLTDQNVLIERVSLELGRGVKSRDLNVEGKKPLLALQDVEQVAFLLEQQDGEELEESQGRWLLAQLTVDWRLAMGQDGTLKTGWLGCRKR